MSENCQDMADSVEGHSQQEGHQTGPYVSRADTQIPIASMPEAVETTIQAPANIQHVSIPEPSHVMAESDISSGNGVSHKQSGNIEHMTDIQIPIVPGSHMSHAQADIHTEAVCESPIMQNATIYDPANTHHVSIPEPSHAMADTDISPGNGVSHMSDTIEARAKKQFKQTGNIQNTADIQLPTKPGYTSETSHMYHAQADFHNGIHSDIPTSITSAAISDPQLPKLHILSNSNSDKQQTGSILDIAQTIGNAHSDVANQNDMSGIIDTVDTVKSILTTDTLICTDHGIPKTISQPILQSGNLIQSDTHVQIQSAAATQTQNQLLSQNQIWDGTTIVDGSGSDSDDNEGAVNTSSHAPPQDLKVDETHPEWAAALLQNIQQGTSLKKAIQIKGSTPHPLRIRTRSQGKFESK